MLSEKRFKQIPIKFKGKGLFIDEENFMFLQKARINAINDKECRPFDGITRQRMHSLAEQGIELLEGGRVLAQELSLVVNPHSADDYFLRTKIGDKWFEWE